MFFLIVNILSANEDSVILRDQCKSDIRSFITKLSPEFSDGLDAGIEKAFKKIKSKYPNRFTTTQNEEDLLAKNAHVISKEDLLKRIKELKIKSSNPLFPKMLIWYQEVETESGLNPAQRVLALRLVDESLRKIKKYEGIQQKNK